MTESPAVVATTKQAEPATSKASLRRVGRGSTTNLIGAVVAGASNLVLAILIAQGLSKSAAGVFFSSTSIFLIALSIGQLGTPTGLVYFLSRCRALATPQLVQAYFRVALRPVMATGLSAALIMFVFAEQIASVTNPHHVDEATTYLRVLAVFVPFACLEQVVLSATRGMGTMKANAVIEQLGRPVTQLALVALALLAPGPAVLGGSWALAYVPAAVVAWWWWRRMYQRLGVHREEEAPRSYGEFWRFTGPRSIATIAQLAMQRLDIVLVGALAGAPEAAIYAAATRFIVAGQMARNAVSLAVQPPLAEALARKDRVEANRLYEISTAWLMCVTWPLYLFLIVFGEPLLGIFGKGYNAGTIVLVLLSGAMLVATLCGDVDIVLIMAGRTSWSLANVSLGFAVNLGLDLWLIPEHGVTGAALGWAVAIMVKNVSALIQVAWVLKLHPFGRAPAVSAVLSVLAFVVVSGSVRVMMGSGLGSFVLALVAGSVTYLAGLWWARDTLHLDSFLASRRRRGSAGPDDDLDPLGPVNPADRAAAVDRQD